ncbi:MAG: radical SAM protein [Desulfobacteraceae bacterium]|jgi:radical SAM superfamily enzyme YgiQ (UPF0313 family)
MRIKLICPTSYDLDNKLIKVKQATLPPLSILYLAGLTPKEHDVQVLDECVQAIDFDEGVDLVGITSMTFTAKRAYQIADEFRGRGVRVVMGGIHASSEVQEALEHADSVVIGEADDLWRKVLEDASAGNLEKTYTSKRRDQLDNLPLPRFDLLDTAKYLHLPFRQSPIMPIQTARGCPFDCEFCSVSRYWGKTVRFRPIRDVIDEISESKADTVFFTDDNFVANSKRSLELCDALTSLKIKYICQIDSLAFRHPEIIEALKKSGCFMAFVGFESIYKNNLNDVNKGFNEPNNYSKLIKMLHKNKINVYASIILGFEKDDPGKVKETVQFLTDEKVALASFFRLTPFPGTRLFERLDEEGVLTDRKWWLKRGEGLGALVKYPDNPHTGEELTSIAMKYFYSWQSIFKRFFPPKGFFLDVLPFNLHAYRKLKKYNKTTIL